MQKVELRAPSEAEEKVLDGFERTALSRFVRSVNNVQAGINSEIQDFVREVAIPFEVEG